MSKSDRSGDQQTIDAGRALLTRGNPEYSAAEISVLVSAGEKILAPKDAIDRWLQDIALRQKVVTPSRAPTPRTPYDDAVEEAHVRLDAARLLEEKARNALLEAKGEWLRLAHTTWFTDGRGHMQRPTAVDSTPEKIDAARAAIDDARERWHAAKVAVSRANAKYDRIARARTWWLATLVDA